MFRALDLRVCSCVFAAWFFLRFLCVNRGLNRTFFDGLRAEFSGCIWVVVKIMAPFGVP